MRPFEGAQSRHQPLGGEGGRGGQRQAPPVDRGGQQGGGFGQSVEGFAQGGKGGLGGAAEVQVARGGLEGAQGVQRRQAAALFRRSLHRNPDTPGRSPWIANWGS